MHARCKLIFYPNPKLILSVSQIAPEGFPIRRVVKKEGFQKGGLLRGLSHSGGLLRWVVKTLSPLRRVTSEGTLVTQETSEGPP